MFKTFSSAQKLSFYYHHHGKIGHSLGRCIFTSCGFQKDETHLKTVLKQKFPVSSKVEVQDVSGGCGAMFEVWIESPEFEGLSKLKQHKIVTEVLKEEIKNMHGIRISTSIPSSQNESGS